MTKEYAITYIEEWLKDEYALNEKDKMVLKMSLKALKQEPFMNKPCISAEVCEHDKQKVLDKIRAEIKALNPEPTAFDVVDGNPIKDAVWETLADVVKIIDKHKTKSEE